MTDSTTIVTDTGTFAAFGTIVASTGLTVGALKFCGTHGYYGDSGTQYYVRARTYFLNLGRWACLDHPSVGFARNRYLYIVNRPTVTVDPSGWKEITRTDPSDGTSKPLKRCRTLDELMSQTPPKPGPEAHDKCDKCVRDLWDNDPQVKKCRQILDPYLDNKWNDKRCGDITPQCKCCEKPWNAYYSPSTHELIVCDEFFDSDKECKSLIPTLCHELVHVQQSRYCRPNDNPYQDESDRCLRSLKKELQAYYCATGCDWFWGCLERVVGSSCPGICDPEKGEPTQDQINALYAWVLPQYQNDTFCPQPLPLPHED